MGLTGYKYAVLIRGVKHGLVTINKVLLVDDEKNILSAYRRQLHRKSIKLPGQEELPPLVVETAESGGEGLKILEEKGPFAVVVSDFRMPGMDGIQFLARAREISPDTVRVMLTGFSDAQLAIDAVNQGNIFRFLTKPCAVDVFMKALMAALEQYRLVTAEKELLEKTLKGSVKVLIELLSMVSPLAFGQSVRLGRLARKLAGRLHLDDPWEIELCSMLSQIGCITVPPDIIQKKLGGEELSQEELEIFLGHPLAGEKLLANIPRLEDTAKAIRSQLERKDYRQVYRLKKENPRVYYMSGALVLALDYDLLVSAGRTPLQAVEIMRDSQAKYDRDLFAALEAEAISLERGYYVRTLGLGELAPGMTLAEEVRDKKGNVLISRDTVITEVLKTRLINYARESPVAEPIKTKEPIRHR